MSFCTQGLPGAAESAVSLSEIQPSPLVKFPTRADEGCEKVLFPGPHPPSAIILPFPEDEGYFFDDGFCDFAFGFTQNDRVVGILRRVKVFGLENPTERKSVAISMDFLMMDCVLVRIVNM